MKRGWISLFLVGAVGIAHAFTPLDGPSATTFQLNPAHDGTTAFNPPLTLPLAEVWRRDFDAALSYPLIADGRVFVAYALTGSTYGAYVLALDETTGATLWGPIYIDGTYYFAGIAYEAKRLFVLNFDGLLQAFDAASGELDWSVQLPGQHAFTSSPSVSGGIVYAGGAGSGGTVYALDAVTGEVLWTHSVENGDSSSPAVADGSVFVSYACPQVYSFDAVTGTQNWHYSGPCEGGGGDTAVARGGRLYVRDWTSSPRGYVFDSDSGGVLDRFEAQTIPAIGASEGYFLQSGTLRGIGLEGQDVHWSFAGDGGLVTAPIVVDNAVFVGSDSGMLYGLDSASGHVGWSINVGAGIPETREGDAIVVPGLAAGDGLVLVPTEVGLVAYASVPDVIFSDGFESE